MKLTQNTDSKVFDRLRLLTRVGIVFLLLIAVVALPSLPALADDKPRSPKARALDDINNGAVADLRPIITKWSGAPRRRKKP